MIRRFLPPVDAAAAGAGGRRSSPRPFPRATQRGTAVQAGNTHCSIGSACGEAEIPLRILITSIVDPARSAHNRLHEFVRHLSGRHDITIISIRDWWKAQQADVSRYLPGWDDTSRRIEVRYLSRRRINPVAQEVFSVLSIGGLLSAPGHFDVHLNYSSLVAGFSAGVRLKARGVRTVYDIADDLPALIRSSPQIAPILRPLGGAFARWMLLRNVKLAERVTLTTDAIALPRGFGSKCEVIPNGVDTAMFTRRDTRELRGRLGLAGDFVIGYVGVLREWIDLTPALQALRILRDEGRKVKFLVIGEEGGLHSSRELAIRCGVSDLVQFLGTIPYAQVPGYLSCMDAGLIPFQVNDVTAGALPLKLLEYMACRIPVVSTRLPGIERAVGDRVVYALEARQIAEAVKWLMINPSKAGALGDDGREFVERRFGWNVMGDKLEAVLENAAAGRYTRQDPPPV
jgi:glycosyltransferase involved in cell wall biosynthesis